MLEYRRKKINSRRGKERRRSRGEEVASTVASGTTYRPKTSIVQPAAGRPLDGFLSAWPPDDNIVAILNYDNDAINIRAEITTR